MRAKHGADLTIIIDRKTRLRPTAGRDDFSAA
jgi:hypothetical protein